MHGRLALKAVVRHKACIFFCCGYRLSLSGPNAVPPSTVEKALELAAFVESNPATDAEVVALCADLQVLGRSEFKTLLKW